MNLQASSANNPSSGSHNLQGRPSKHHGGYPAELIFDASAEEPSDPTCALAKESGVNASTDAEAAFLELHDLPETVEAGPKPVRGHLQLVQDFLQRCRQKSGMDIPPVDNSRLVVEDSDIGHGHGCIGLVFPEDDSDSPVPGRVGVAIITEDPEGRRICGAIACDMETGREHVESGIRGGGKCPILPIKEGQTLRDWFMSELLGDDSDEDELSSNDECDSDSEQDSESSNCSESHYQ
ncbi:hypothetical protein NMY22_g19972 [Coprinellus aureogranulatus]|nr:hypothetical protein NMY22_g19972 [Coprinellus aureogranulatus]